MLTKRLFCFLFLFFLINNESIAKESPAKTKKWVGTWGTAPQLVEPSNMPPAPGLSNNTLRQVVCVSIGGKKLQLKFSNKFGKAPVTMKAVQIAVSTGGSSINGSTSKTLKFKGRQEVTMQPGEEITSHAVSFDLKPRMEVAITISFGEVSPTLTGHPGSVQHLTFFLAKKILLKPISQMQLKQIIGTSLPALMCNRNLALLLPSLVTL
ncbi:MAG: hypothetical protein J7502_04830 [Flavisolibacter sp.]|nr:hypothetical protein [Flavisolibacter sp.]